MRLLLLILSSLALVGCNDKAGRSSEDILICKQFYAEARMRMDDDLKRETFQPGDLTFDQLRTLTPRDPDWHDAQFLVLDEEWGRTNEPKRIVIVCGQSRVSEGGQRVHCVGYSTGETAWLSESEGEFNRDVLLRRADLRTDFSPSGLMARPKTRFECELKVNHSSLRPPPSVQPQTRAWGSPAPPPPAPPRSPPKSSMPAAKLGLGVRDRWAWADKDAGPTGLAGDCGPGQVCHWRAFGGSGYGRGSR